MNIAEVLRSIEFDFVEYIQQKVKVEFDNFKQMPLSFIFKNKRYVVDKIMGRFKMRKDYPPNGYLLCSGKEVFFLYFHYYNFNPKVFINSGTWVLSFRILKDEELMKFYLEDRKMLIDMNLKRVVDFHGHLCPDLAIGVRVCEFIKDLVPSKGAEFSSISIIAENSTSAIDAIQILLGTTLGNQRLYIADLGKHNYTVILPNHKQGINISLKSLNFKNETQFCMLEEKISKNEIVFEEVVMFQKLLDDRVKHIFNTPLKELFKVKDVEVRKHLVEFPSLYVKCSKCGEEVLKTHAIVYKQKSYCISCLQKIEFGNKKVKLQ